MIHQIHADEAAYKLCRVEKHVYGAGGNPHIITHDGRTIRSTLGLSTELTSSHTVPCLSNDIYLAIPYAPPSCKLYPQTSSKGTGRFPDPDVKANDTVLVNLESGKIENKCKFEIGALCMIKGGNNTGRVGTITSREKHPGSFEIIHVKDAAGNSFCTRLGNVMVIGETGLHCFFGFCLVSYSLSMPIDEPIHRRAPGR